MNSEAVDRAMERRCPPGKGKRDPSSLRSILRLDVLRRTVARFGLFGLLDRVCREIWLRLGLFLLRLLGVEPKGEYGWLEAILFPVADYWLRCAAIVKVLSKYGGGNHRLRAVEVGSGSGGPARLYHACAALAALRTALSTAVRLGGRRPRVRLSSEESSFFRVLLPSGTVVVERLCCPNHGVNRE